MKLLRSRVKIKKLTEDDDNYVDLSFQDRLSIMWEITREVWSLRGEDAERRLQRNVAHLVKKQG